MSGAYVELEHPADVWLQVRAPGLPGLLENALYAFYSQIVDLRDVVPERAVTLISSGDSPDEVLRALLAEALFRFETEGFLAAGARVEIDESAADGARGADAAAERRAPRLRAAARVWGESADRGRHSLLAEVKAVTYHRLSVEQTADGGWRATVLLDV